MKQVVLYLFVVMFLAGCGNAPEFSSIALGKDSSNAIVLESSSRVVDNLFKSEYAYLINYGSKGIKSWLSSLSLSHYDEVKDGNPDFRQYLIDYFPNTPLKSDDSKFYHLGERKDGREHYMLVFIKSNMAIYYVATI